MCLKVIFSRSYGFRVFVKIIFSSQGNKVTFHLVRSEASSWILLQFYLIRKARGMGGIYWQQQNIKGLVCKFYILKISNVKAVPDQVSLL